MAAIYNRDKEFPRAGASDKQRCIYTAEMVESPFFAVPLARRVDEGQVFGGAGFKKRFFNGDGDFLGKADPDKTACRNRVTVPYHTDGLFGGHDFAFFRLLGRQCRKHRMAAGF